MWKVFRPKPPVNTYVTNIRIYFDDKLPNARQRELVADLHDLLNRYGYSQPYIGISTCEEH